MLPDGRRGILPLSLLSSCPPQKRLASLLSLSACHGSPPNGTQSSSSSPLPSSRLRPHWLVTGGSYAGALSAWARLKYPHLFHAALSSSGVVHVIKDFTDFDRQVNGGTP